MPPPVPTLRTARLLLRPWCPEDLEPFAALNADPEVMAHFPFTMTREESDAFAARIQGLMADRGFGMWAVEVPGVAPFIGFVGLAVPSFQTHFTPCIELGWRLMRAHWGHGYATEAAHEAVRFGFEELDAPELVSFTVPKNVRSRAVMERLGMTRDPLEDFEHPSLPVGHPLRPHVLYRLSRERWEPARAER